MSTFNGTIPQSYIDPTTGEINSDLCTLSTCPLSLANFTYVPNLAGNALFLAIFAALILPQLGLAWKGRTWGFGFAMFAGLLLEILGYVGRVQMHFNPFPQDPFILYIVTLTIAPAFLTAAIYLCLGRIVVVFSTEASRIKPGTYTLIFVACDFLSLVLQAAGGGITASAGFGQQSQRQAGVNIMIAGLAFQVFSLVIFIVLAGEYAWRLRQRPSMRNPQFADLRASRFFQAFLWGLGLATFTIFIRCVFRVAELSQGFDGPIANNEVVYMILEGPMIIIACVSLTVLHPALSFRGRWAESNWSFRGAPAVAATKEAKSVSTSSSDVEAAGVTQYVQAHGQK